MMAVTHLPEPFARACFPVLVGLFAMPVALRKEKEGNGQMEQKGRGKTRRKRRKETEREKGRKREATEKKSTSPTRGWGFPEKRTN